MKKEKDKQTKIPKELIFFVISVIFLTITIIIIAFAGRGIYLYGEDFGIEPIKSGNDFDGDGIDDSTDILYGARWDAENKPDYDGSYQEGGYPPDNIGVCTDVVWRAFANAGYSLKLTVSKDVNARTGDYPNVVKPDGNIDFRRVKNLRVFFDTYAEILTDDINDIEEWQPGDIVIFGENQHIGIVSDRRNGAGRTYIIHNGGQRNREEDFLGKMKVAAHYRFDGAKLPPDLQIAYEGKVK